MDLIHNQQPARGQLHGKYAACNPHICLRQWLHATAIPQTKRYIHTARLLHTAYFHDTCLQAEYTAAQRCDSHGQSNLGTTDTFNVVRFTSYSLVYTRNVPL